MRPRLAALAVALLLAGVAEGAAAGELSPRKDLRIAGLRVVGPEAWTAENRFKLRWELELPGDVPRELVTGVYYRVADPGGGSATRVEGIETVDNVRLTVAAGAASPPPGEYPVEVWLETEREFGPPTLTTLRFDDRRPAAAEPRVPLGWVRGDAEPLLRIGHPPGPQPLSGIRGYAVSVRPDSAAPPCAGPDRCTLAETDLRGGIGDDGLGLGVLAEGLHVVGVVAVSGSGMRSAVATTAEVRVDATRPDLELSGAAPGWSNRPVRVVARASDALSGMDAAGPTGPLTTIAADDGAPVIAQGEEASMVVAGSGVHSVSASARDAAGNERGDAGSAPARAVVRIDEEPPAVRFARAADPEEPELIEATVGDALSGPDPVRGTIALRALGSGQAFEPLPTTVSAGRLTARWDSDSYPHGRYEFRASGHDLAGNAASSTLRADGSPMGLSNPVKAPVAIRFGFGGRQMVWHRCVRIGEGRSCRREVIAAFERRPDERTVPYGKRPQVGGRVLSAAGAPLAGATIELVESFDGGARIRTRTTAVETGPDGVFLARLAPGPSRRVEARFGGTRLLTRGASRGLRLGIQTAVRLRASTAQAAIGGAPVVFSGRVGRLEATIPSYGRPVQLQFRLPGSPWTEFRTIQTGARGDFRYPYAFSDDDSHGIRFLFRAYAPPQPGWPYEPAASRPVAVTGY